MTIDLTWPGILEALPVLGRSLTFRMIPYADPFRIEAAARGFALDWGVLGIGEPVARALRQEVKGLRVFPGLAGPACSVPSTQQGLWCFFEDRTVEYSSDLTERIGRCLVKRLSR